MTKRRLIRWSLIVMVVAALAVWLEPTRVVWGWLRGEEFYKGRPTSFWRGVIQRDLQTEPRVLLARAVPIGEPSANWLDRSKEWIDARLHTLSSQDLVTWDKEAAGVLQALTSDPDEKIAGFAGEAMQYSPWTAPVTFWLGVIRKHR